MKNGGPFTRKMFLYGVERPKQKSNENLFEPSTLLSIPLNYPTTSLLGVFSNKVGLKGKTI